MCVCVCVCVAAVGVSHIVGSAALELGEVFIEGKERGHIVCNEGVGLLSPLEC